MALITETIGRASVTYDPATGNVYAANGNPTSSGVVTTYANGTKMWNASAAWTTPAASADAGMLPLVGAAVAAYFLLGS